MSMHALSRCIQAPITVVSQRISWSGICLIPLGAGVGIVQRFGADSAGPPGRDEMFRMIGAHCEENEFDVNSLIGS